MTSFLERQKAHRGDHVKRQMMEETFKRPGLEIQRDDRLVNPKRPVGEVLDEPQRDADRHGEPEKARRKDKRRCHVRRWHPFV